MLVGKEGIHETDYLCALDLPSTVFACIVFIAQQRSPMKVKNLKGKKVYTHIFKNKHLVSETLLRIIHCNRK